MHRAIPIALAAVLLAGDIGAQQPSAGFVPLFNGRDLTGWHGMPHFDPNKLAALDEPARKSQVAEWTADAVEHWRVEDGELVNDGKGAYLTTDREFGDIELLLEYKTVAKADSGIYLRATPQVQIWDFTEAGGKWNLGADKGSGGLYNNKRGGKNPLELADKPFGEWNKFRIRQVGDKTSVWLNDRLVVDNQPLENFWNRARPLDWRGPIQLQTHGGEIRWRNLFVREIGAAEANQILAATEKDFTPIFNGRDFSGWTGATANYQVQDGAIVCRPGKGGNIYTEEQFDDFIVRMEFKLPPGGNNGLAIRSPLTGRPSVDAMCEIQILDSEHPKYAKLDPRQYHGSIYGMIPAHRGYLREVGQWNYQQVTVVGSRIKVELNGYTIVDGDVSKVTEFKGDTPHPGKDRLRGHFGFAGHNDPVAFRNIRVKRLQVDTAARKQPADKAVAAVTATAESAAETPARKKSGGLHRGGPRIVFVGDSITAAGGYVNIIEAALLDRAATAETTSGSAFAKLKWEGVPELIALGLSSETISGLSEPHHPFPRPYIHERLDRVLAATRPNIVVACYGMNCAIYHPFGEQRFAAYRQGIDRLISKCRAIGAEVILLTPPPYAGAISSKTPPADGVDYGYRTPYADYDQVLARYAAWVMTLDREGVSCVDVRSPILASLRDCYGRDPIHPNQVGHQRMAEALLTHWGLAEQVAAQSEPSARRTQLLQLVTQRRAALDRALLWHIGHQRPGKPPKVAWSAAQLEAVDYDRKIAALLADR